jgi:hypothetical protein
VDGALYERSELTYTEDTPALSVLDARNGSPYQIRDIVVPLRGYTDSGTYALRAKSQVIDQKISDYLTLKTPEAPTALPNVISERYTVYSPFFNSIMADLKAGRLSSIALKVYYNDELVRTMCQPYEWLLEFDPSHPDNHVDPRYVVVHAHNQNQVVDVDAYQYKFLSRVAAIYLNQRVVLSHVLRMV